MLRPPRRRSGAAPAARPLARRALARCSSACLAACLAAAPALPRAAPAPAPIPDLPELTCDLPELQAEFDIPIEINARVVRALRAYQAPGARRGLVRWLSRARGLGPPLRAILREQRVPEDLLYLAMVESGLASGARSGAGAVGPWQLVAATGRQLGLRVDRWVDERRDPEKAARAAARLLRRLHARTGDWPLAWAAYNAGPGRLAGALRRGGSGLWDLDRRRLLPRETRDYVPRIPAPPLPAQDPARRRRHVRGALGGHLAARRGAVVRPGEGAAC